MLINHKQSNLGPDITSSGFDQMQYHSPTNLSDVLTVQVVNTQESLKTTSVKL
jgi:hypothetical protein